MTEISSHDITSIEALYNALCQWIDTGVEDKRLFGTGKELPFFSNGVLYARLGIPVAYLLPTSGATVKTLFVTSIRLNTPPDNANTAYGDGQVRNVLLSVAKSRELPIFYCINPEQYPWIASLKDGENVLKKASGFGLTDEELVANNLATEWMGLISQSIYFYQDSRNKDSNFGQKKYDAQRSLDCVRTLKLLQARVDAASPTDRVIGLFKEMTRYDLNLPDIEHLFNDLDSNYQSFIEELKEVRARRASEDGEGKDDCEIV